MAKTSVVERNKQRIALTERNKATRAALKEAARAVYNSEEASVEERMEANARLQKRRRNENPVRIRKRCAATGRPRSLGFTGLSHKYLRDKINEGIVPGVTKSSW